MTQFGVILVAVDQSEQSDKAVEVARDLAKLSGGNVHLLHIREHEVVYSRLGGSFETETKEEVESLLAKEVRVLRGSDVTTTAKVVYARHQDTARVIVEEAENASADVIVMGTRGLSAFGALMLGSNAYKVLHNSKCPVLVVP